MPELLEGAAVFAWGLFVLLETKPRGRMGCLTQPASLRRGVPRGDDRETP